MKIRLKFPTLQNRSEGNGTRKTARSLYAISVNNLSSKKASLLRKLCDNNEMNRWKMKKLHRT